MSPGRVYHRFFWLQGCVVAWLVLAGLPLRADDASKLPALSAKQIVVQLRDADEKKRDEALDALRLLSEHLSPADGKILLEATAEQFPKTLGSSGSVAAELLETAASKPTEDGLKFIDKHYEKYDAAAKAMALAYMIRLKSSVGDKRFVELFVKGEDGLDWVRPLSEAVVESLPNDVIQAGLIAALSNPKRSGLAAQWLYEAIDKEKIESVFIEKNVKAISAACDYWVQRLQKHKAALSANKNYRWEEVYRNDLSAAEYFPDLLGHGGLEAEQSLRESLKLQDPRISLFAVDSLLKLGLAVAPEDVAIVAADDEMRNMLFEKLMQLGKAKLFPREYYSQEAFARSAMVQWLIYPTELGHPPKQIELIKVVETTTKTDGRVDVYLFRFQSGDKDDTNWMVGVAGGYKKSDTPVTTGTGMTFSTFEKYDAAHPEKHVERIVKLTEDRQSKKDAP